MVGGLAGYVAPLPAQPGPRGGMAAMKRGLTRGRTGRWLVSLLKNIVSPPTFGSLRRLQQNHQYFQPVQYILFRNRSLATGDVRAYE